MSFLLNIQTKCGIFVRKIDGTKQSFTIYKHTIYIYIYMYIQIYINIHTYSFIYMKLWNPYMEREALLLLGTLFREIIKLSLHPILYTKKIN